MFSEVISSLSLSASALAFLSDNNPRTRIHLCWRPSNAAEPPQTSFSSSQEEIERFGVTQSKVRVSCSSSSSQPPIDDEKNPRTEDHRVTFPEILVKTSKLYHRTSSSALAEPEDGANPCSSHPAAYNSLMKSFSRVGKVDEVLRLFRQMKQEAGSSCYYPNVLCHNTLLNSLAIAKRFHALRAVFDEMCSYGIIPNVSTFNILVKAYSCYSHQFDLAFRVLDEMSVWGCNPDVTTYSTLITGLSRAGRVEDREAVLDLMLDKGCYPNVYSFVPILKAHCEKGDIKAAEKVIETMLLSSNYLQNNSSVVVYNIWIDALCKSGHFDEVELIFKEATSKGTWKPNTISYNTYMNALCKVGKADEAFTVLEIMMGDGLYPTVVTVNILLDSLCHASKVVEAKKLLDLGFHFGWEFSLVCYNIVMSTLCKIGRWRSVMMLLVDMLKKGVVLPNTRTYNIVVHSLCEAKKLREAEYLVESKGFTADVVTYNTLLNGYCKTGNISQGNHLYHRMTIMEKIDPDIFTYTILIEMHCKNGKIKDAIGFFDEADLKGFLPDLVAYSTLIDGCLKNGMLDKALQLLYRMLEQGLVPNIAVQESFVRACCKKNQSCVWISIKKLLGRR